MHVAGAGHQLTGGVCVCVLLVGCCVRWSVVCKDADGEG